MPGEDGDFDVGVALADVNSGLGLGSSDLLTIRVLMMSIWMMLLLGLLVPALLLLILAMAELLHLPRHPVPPTLATPPGTWRKRSRRRLGQTRPDRPTRSPGSANRTSSRARGLKADAQMGRSLQQVLQPTSTSSSSSESTPCSSWRAC